MKKTTDGLILRVVEVGESDKLLTVLTKDGRITVSAKGVRSMKSKSASLCHPFTYANLEYYEKEGRRWLSGGSVNASFFGLNQSLAGYALAAYLLSLATEITDEGVEAEDVLRTTLNALYAIQKELSPIPLIKASYEWFAAMTSGYMPELDTCSVCSTGDMCELWLDVMNGALICDACQKKRTGSIPLPEVDRYETRNVLVPLDGSALAAIRYVSTAPLSRLFSFSLSGQSADYFCRAAETYLLHHLERDFDTLEFYRTVKD